VDLTITFAGGRTQRLALGTPRYPLRTVRADYQQPGAKPIPAYDYSFLQHRWLPAP
jgi:hypothetical protein